MLEQAKGEAQAVGMAVQVYKVLLFLRICHIQTYICLDYQLDKYDGIYSTFNLSIGFFQCFDFCINFSAESAVLLESQFAS